jgi:hypothetical protein
MWMPRKGHLKLKFRDFFLMAGCLIPWPQDLNPKLSIDGYGRIPAQIMD